MYYCFIVLFILMFVSIFVLVFFDFKFLGLNDFVGLVGEIFF